MKMYKDSNSMPHLLGTVTIGIAICAASALHAQSTDSATPQASQMPIPGSSAELSHQGREFLQFAAQANKTEMAMADLAEARSQNGTVKDISQTMIPDYGENYAQVQLIALTHWFALDASLNLVNQHAVKRLTKASDQEFDKDYTTLMIKDHVHAIKRFDKAAARMDAADLKQYALSTLPTLRKHLQEAEIAARSAGVDDATISSILKGLPSEAMERGSSVNLN
jgi:putative membrane protein